ncbi:hypothetical protein J7L87_01750 [bacterium]|nr:hypothetical protein [bacterium]
MFIATCGTKLDSIKFKDDILKDWWWETIKGYFLERGYLFDYLKANIS